MAYNSVSEEMFYFEGTTSSGLNSAGRTVLSRLMIYLTRLHKRTDDEKMGDAPDHPFNGLPSL